MALSGGAPVAWYTQLPLMDPVGAGGVVWAHAAPARSIAILRVAAIVYSIGVSVTCTVAPGPSSTSCALLCNCQRRPMLSGVMSKGVLLATT